jgi:putative ATP-dependent endonuclease of OLD family
MTRFHRSLDQHTDIRGDLEQLFSEIKTKFHEMPEFSTFVAGLREHMADLVSSMSHKLEVDFEAYNPVNFFHALRLQAAEGANARTLEEMGTGEQQILAMAFAHAYAKAFHTGILLVIEEPESHLHPLAQLWLAKRLTSLTTGDLQVIITTHSPAFIDILNLEGLCLVRKDEAGTHVTQVTREELVTHARRLGADHSRTRVASILPFYRANATREVLEGFFAKLVVLVEGPTEALSLPIYLGRLGLNCEKQGVAVIHAQGKGNLGKWRRLFTAFGISTYVIFDNDGRKDDREGTKRKDALRSVGVDDAATLDQLIAATETVIEHDYLIFGQNFEVNMRTLFARYGEVEEEVQGEGVDSKPFVARAVAERLELDENQAGWQLFGTLRECLLAKLGTVE